MLVSKTVEMKWNPANRKRYEGLGYTFTKWGERFFIDIKDLSKTSNTRVIVKCDDCRVICNGTKGIAYKDYNKVIQRNNNTYRCVSCSLRNKPSKYPKETLILMLQTRYNKGLDCNSYALQKEDRKLYDAMRYTKDFEKIEDIYEVAGIDYTKVHKRLNETNWTKELVIERFLERYNDDIMKCNPGILKEDDNALYIAIRRQFGSYKNLCDHLDIDYQPLIKNKLYINGIKASQPQIDLGEFLGYEINIKIHNKCVDIVDQKNKVAIEYDGGGHRLSVALNVISEEEFTQKEKEVENTLMKNGWTFIRIKNEQDLPLDYEIIKHQINETIISDLNHMLIEIS